MRLVTITGKNISKYDTGNPKSSRKSKNIEYSDEFMDFINTHILYPDTCYVCRRSEDDFQKNIVDNYNDQIRTHRKKIDDELEQVNQQISNLFAPLIDKFSEHYEKFKDKDYLDFKLSAVYADFSNFQKLIPNLGMLLVLFYSKPQRHYDFYSRSRSNDNSNMQIRDLVNKLSKVIVNAKKGVLENEVASLLRLDDFPEILNTGKHTYDEDEIEYTFENLRHRLERREETREVDNYYEEFDDEDLDEIITNARDLIRNELVITKSSKLRLADLLEKKALLILRGKKYFSIQLEFSTRKIRFSFNKEERYTSYFLDLEITVCSICDSLIESDRNYW